MADRRSDELPTVSLGPDAMRELRMISGNTSTMANIGAMIGSFSTGITNFIKSTTRMAPEMQKMGAKFSKSFLECRVESKAIAHEFAEAGIPANVYDAFSFNLQATRLGLDENSTALRDLFGVTMATGEIFGKLI